VKVILKQDIKGVGKAGSVADVAEGYGRNYLLPRGLALEATTGSLAQLAGQREAKERRDEKLLAEAREVAALFASKPLEIKAKGGDRGKLFGAVTNAQVADALRAAFGVEIDRHKIELPEPIKAAGDYACTVKLAHGVTARVSVRVVAGA
jgi:large subunit ribosomal protein L9